MYRITPTTMIFPPDAARGPIHACVAENLDGLRNAARLLGGQNGIRLFHEVLAALHHETSLSSWTKGRLRQMKALLFLKNTSDPNRPEAGYYAALTPAAPEVEEICLLTDIFCDALEKAGLDIPSASRPRSVA